MTKPKPEYIINQSPLEPEPKRPLILRSRAAFSLQAESSQPPSADPPSQPAGSSQPSSSLGLAPSSRLEFRARLVSAGRIRRADGAPGPFSIPDETLIDALDRSLFHGLGVFVDHPGWFDNPSIKAMVGVIREPYWNDLTRSINGTIRFYNTEENGLAQAVAMLLSEMLSDAKEGIEPPDIGMSIVFWPTWEEQERNPRVLKSFRKIDSADIVFGPAADGRILEALSSYRKEVNLMSTTEFIDPAEDLNVILPAESAQPGTAADVPAAAEPDPQPVAQAQLQSWTDAAGREAARSIIAHSQLPQISRDKLMKMDWTDPTQLYKAIEDERTYLAELTQSNVIALSGGPPRGHNIQVQTNLDYFANAVDWVFGVEGAKLPEPQLRRMDMIYSMLTGDHEFRGVFQPERVFLAGADTGTLANMAANAMNKVVMAQLALLTHYRWYEFVAMPTPNDGSLHDMQWTSFGGISTLPIVPEGGAYDELDVDDVKEADSWVTYGGYVGITRKMIKNSDIQRIQAIPRALAAASIKTRSAKIAAIFSQASGVGPTLDQDSVVLFHTDHSNLATTALGSDMTAWRAAATECFKHTEVSSGNRIGLFPKYCLVPPDLYHAALANFGYGEGMPTTYLPEAQDRGVGDPRPVVLAVPDWTDATDWAYLADPNIWPVVHMSFSQDPSGRGFPAPELFAATSETGGLLFAADVLPVKVRDEFAYGVNGYRGIGKRNVAG